MYEITFEKQKSGWCDKCRKRSKQKLRVLRIGNIYPYTLRLKFCQICVKNMKL